ncbi:MAG: hypothetical protein Kow0059_00460 [Candidatus Sumerlaeia bacterium]
MPLSAAAYSLGAAVFKEDHLTVYDSVHSMLGKRASVWVYDVPADSMTEAADHFFRQLGLQASRYHPDVAPIYAGGTEGQQFFCVQEPLLDGSLAQHISQHPTRNREEFYQVFAPLIHLLRGLARLALSWERLRLSDIVVIGPGRYRIQRWNPLSDFDRVPLGNHLGERLAGLPGLYCAEENFDFDRNAHNLARWMFGAVAPGGRTLEAAVRDFQAALREKRRKDAPPVRFLPEADLFIERLIYKLAVPKIQGGFDGMDDVVKAIERVRHGNEPEPLPEASPFVDRALGGAAAADAMFRETILLPTPAALPSGYAATRTRTRPRRRYLLPLVIALAAAAAGGLGYLAYSRLVHPNHPPTARIVLLQTEARHHEKVLFDGSQSHDADGDLLHYYWRIVEPADIGVDYYISRNRNPSARTTTIQFFRNGRYKVCLQVMDGKTFSEPDCVTINITD